jgi:hypothetical protein
MTAHAPLRVLVCGGRDYDNGTALFAALDTAHAETPIGYVIQGGAPGADFLAKLWAEARNVPCVELRADWRAHGRSAGPIRNMLMLEKGKPDLVLAFPGGRGTADMVRQARAAGVRVREIASEGGENE